MKLENLPPIQKLAPILVVIIASTGSLVLLVESIFAKFLFGFLAGASFAVLLILIILGIRSKS